MKKNNFLKILLFSLLLVPIVGFTTKILNTKTNDININTSKNSALKKIDVELNDGSIVQTSNIDIVSKQSDVLSMSKDKLVLVNESQDLSYKVKNDFNFEFKSEEIATNFIARGSTCQSYNDNIYIFGGFDSTNSFSSNIYKFNNDELVTMDVSLPVRLAYSTSCIFNNFIYIFGGFAYGNGRINNIYKFDCINETIEKLDVFVPKSLYSSGCSVYENYAYIFGGQEDDCFVNSIYKFNLVNESFENISLNLPFTLTEFCCVTFSEKIYLFGGRYDAGDPTDKIICFNALNETIETLDVVLPKKIYNPLVISLNDCAYIFSALYNNGAGSDYYTNIICFDFKLNEIKLLENQSSHNRFEGIVSMIGNNIYTFGDILKDKNDYIFKISLPSTINYNDFIILDNDDGMDFNLNNEIIIDVKNVYIGNSNNEAELAEAYLFDESLDSWVNVNTGEPLEVGGSNA